MNWKNLVSVWSFVAISSLQGSLIDTFCKAVLKNNRSRVEEIVGQKPTIINEQNKYGASPLCLAISHNHFDLAQFLLNNGADANIRGDKNKTRQNKCPGTSAYKTQQNPKCV